MEEGWERRTPTLTLDHATIAEMLRPFAADATLQDAEILGGGLANTNYKVTLAGRDEPIVLRVYTRDRAACAIETALLRLVHDEVPVAEVLFAETEGKVGGHPYMVLSWVEGVKPHTVLTEENAEEIGHACGATLATIGRHTFAADGFFGSDLSIAEPFGPVREWVPQFIEHCLFEEHGAENLGGDLAERVRRLLADNAALLDEVDATPRLIHGDYKSANLLLRHRDAHWEMAAALDWEFAYAGTPLFDLGILLRESERRPAGLERGVVRGYREAGGILPTNWKRITRLLDLVNLCQFAATSDARTATLHDVSALIRATIERWDD